MPEAITSDSASQTAEPSVLAGEGISVRYGGVTALDGVDVVLTSNEVLGIIGPNGAGKTTLVNVLSGFQPPTSGRVRLEGRDVTRIKAQRRARLGVVRTFQSVRLFKDLTVQENVVVGALAVGLRLQQAHARAADLLDVLGLADVAGREAGALPYGIERRVGIARAAAAEPAYLLLDEPAAGLSEDESRDLVRSITAVRASLWCGILLVEHDMDVVMQLSDRIQVLNFGRTLAIGSPQEIQSDPGVIDAYLGSGNSSDA